MKTWTRDEVLRIARDAIELFDDARSNADRDDDVEATLLEVAGALDHDEEMAQAQFEELLHAVREHGVTVSDWSRAAPEAFEAGRASRDAEVARLVAERERLLWLACRSFGSLGSAGWRILREHNYDAKRIAEVSCLPEPVVPKP